MRSCVVLPMASKGTASKACFTKAFSPRCKAMLTARPNSWRVTAARMV